MPTRRPIQFFDIRERNPRPAVSVVSALNFTAVPALSQADLPELSFVVPYAADFRSTRLVCVATDDNAAALRAPFLYHACYERAQSYCTIPFERLNEVTAAPGFAPLFVFSIGRCGSTLLTAGLQAVGMRSVSEPDVYTHLTQLAPMQRRALGGLWALVSDATAKILSLNCGSGALAIKLRSHCAGIARQILAASPKARAVFILRDPVPWALSRHRAFGSSPARLAHLYLWGVRSYLAICAVGHACELIWYEDLIADPVAVMARLAPAGAAGTAAGRWRPALEEVLARDSQLGTSLQRGSARFGDFGPAAQQAFMAGLRQRAMGMDLSSPHLERLRSQI